jgi:uncharacterized phage protein (TIGR02218 family)
MAGHLSGRSHTRCNMLLLDLVDGTAIGVTDHDKPIDYDIGDGVVTYDAGTGILTSERLLSASLDADNYEVTGPISDIVTLDAVVGGRFNRARARLFEINWKDLTQGAIKVLAGNVAEARVEGGKFTFEIRGDTDRYNQTVGRLITDSCDADFADGIRCFATATEIVGTVTAVTDAMRFTVSFTGTYADDLFNKGTVEFLTGASGGHPQDRDRGLDGGWGNYAVRSCRRGSGDWRHNDDPQRLRQVTAGLHGAQCDRVVPGLSGSTRAQGDDARDSEPVICRVRRSRTAGS